MSNSSQSVPKLCRTLLQEDVVAVSLHGVKEAPGKREEKGTEGG